MEIEVPIGNPEGDLTIQEEGSLDLTGIKVPFGFRPLSNAYIFGPHGLKFERGKTLRLNLKIDPTLLQQNESLHNVRLFYINQESHRLELVPDQNIDKTTKTLKAEISHFSSFITGITSGWDGNGLSPFVDYSSFGEEHVCLFNVQTNVVASVISLKGRGLNLNIDRTFADGSVNYDDSGYDKNPLAINNQWRWSFPCFFTYDGKFTLYLSDGAGYQLGTIISDNYLIGERRFNLVSSNGVVFATPYEQSDSQITEVYLKDGTYMQFIPGD